MNDKVIFTVRDLVPDSYLHHLLHGIFADAS